MRPLDYLWFSWLAVNVADSDIHDNLQLDARPLTLQWINMQSLFISKNCCKESSQVWHRHQIIIIYRHTSIKFSAKTAHLLASGCEQLAIVSLPVEYGMIHYNQNNHKPHQKQLLGLLLRVESSHFPMIAVIAKAPWNGALL